MIRSVLAVLAGIVVLIAVSFAIELTVNPLLMWAFPQSLPNPEAVSANLWVRAVTFTYGFVCVAFGGYVAAWIARRRPVTHAAALGIVQAGLTIVAMFSPESNHASRLQWILMVLLTIPTALVGGVVYRSRKANDGLENASAGA